MANNKLLITESEKNHILNLYGNSKETIYDEVAITEWLSPDEKFVIFLDDLIDIENKKLIGNIWENFDNFKLFLRHSFNVSDNVPKTIKEEVIKQIDNLVLTESTKDFSYLKPFVKELIIEQGTLSTIWDTIKGVPQGLVDYVKKTAKETPGKIYNFGKTVGSGIKSAISSVSSGEWSKVWDIIKKGTLYLARAIRSALYHPVGLILDAILIATGIGKGFQAAVWSIVVALDLYELISGDYEDKSESFLMRLLFTGVDIIGLVSAGAAAVASRKVLIAATRGAKSTEELTKVASKNLGFKNLLNTIYDVSLKASSKMSESIGKLKTKNPKIASWVEGVFSRGGNFFKKIIDVIGKILRPLGVPGKVASKIVGGKTAKAGVEAGVNTAALIGTIGGAATSYGNVKQKELEKVMTSNTTEPIFNIDNI